MNVLYWGIGVNSAIPLPMTQNDIEGYLIKDWVPSLPISTTSAFIGGPFFLIELDHDGPLDYLALKKDVGSTERQWKGFLSWMLGVAGTRHVLAQEGYQWIAPVSAFYSNANTVPDLSNWHRFFMPGALNVDSASNSTSRLRPDYLAIRQNNRGFDWAVIESKGTHLCLQSMNRCPGDWRNQARNLIVHVNGNRLRVPRHIVVATRSNPNAVFRKTRRLQIRAWNSMDEPSAIIPNPAAVDIASADLFGLFRNLGFFENTRALSFSMRARAKLEPTPKVNNNVVDMLKQLRERADTELDQISVSQKGTENSRTRILNTELGEVVIEISGPTLDLASKLSVSTNEDEASDALLNATLALRGWKSQKVTDRGEVFLQPGIKVRFPYQDRS